MPKTDVHDCRRRAVAAVLMVVALAVPVRAAGTTAKLGVYRLPGELAAELGERMAGAMVYWVVPSSSAGKAGLKPGDVITQINDQSIESFGQLTAVIRTFAAGDTIHLKYLRAGHERIAKLTLSIWAGQLTDAAYREALAYLKKLRRQHQGVALQREIIEHHWRLGERAVALREISRTIKQFPQDTSLELKRLEMLKKSGDYSEYVRAAIALADKTPDSAAALLEKLDALIATGRLTQAEKLADRLCGSTRGWFRGVSADTAEALQCWTMIRLREGKSLEGGRASADAWQHPAVTELVYWKRKLAGKAPYGIPGKTSSSRIELHKSDVLFGLAPYKMHGITIRINGTEVPLAIIDTGASHTLLSTATAHEAGVEIGSDQRQAAGSLAFSARPALVRTLQIGDIVINDVPVTVGNPPPLVITKAKVALGVNLMHHLRFTIDYPEGKVLVEPARTARPVSTDDQTWEIPLWTFTEHCLSQAQLPDGEFARVLIDSGNFAQTLVWPTWARHHIEGHPGATDSLLIFAFRQPHHQIKGLRLGGRSMPEWPVMDMPPVTLRGVDLLDLLMGHDLLSQYVVTIDMRNRRLLLKSAGAKFKPPVAPRAFLQ